MKKVLSLLMVVLMLCGISMLGCTVEPDETTTAATTEELPVLLTAEEYFLKAYEADLEKSLAFSYDYTSAGISLSAKDIDYLLSLFAMKDLGIPSISDVELDILADSESMQEAIILAAVINGTPAAAALHMDMQTLDYTLSSNLFEDVYGVDGETIFSMNGMEKPDYSKINKYANDFVKEYAYYIGDLLAKHNGGMNLTDNGDTVTVDFEIDGANMFSFTEELINTLADDAEFVEFLNEIYRIDFAEAKEAFDAERDTIAENLKESGAKIDMSVVIDKETFVCPSGVMTIFDSNESVTFTVNAGDGLFNIEVEAPTATVAANCTYTEDEFDFDMQIANEESDIDIKVTLENEVLDATVTVTATEYDWDNGGEVTVQNIVTVNGSFVANDDEYRYTLKKIAYNDIEIDLEPAGISFTYLTNCDVPEMPEATKSALDMTEEEGNALLESILVKLGLDPAMFEMGNAEPDYGYDSYDEYENYDIYDYYGYIDGEA